MRQRKRWPALLYCMVLALAGAAAVAMWAHLITTRGMQLLEALPALAAVALLLASASMVKRRWPRTTLFIDITLTLAVITAATHLLVTTGLNTLTLVACILVAGHVTLEVRAWLQRRSKRREATKQTS